MIEGNGLCAIYADGTFDFVCTAHNVLDDILTTQNLILQEMKEERLCSQCEKPMYKGFNFESDGTQYCGEQCLTEVISWNGTLEDP